MQLEEQIIQVKGVGEKTAGLFHKLHIDTISDLLFYLPKGFEIFEEPKMPDEKDNGRLISFQGVLKPGTLLMKKSGHYTLSTAVLMCKNTPVKVRFFNMPYLKNLLLPGKTYILRGVLEITKDQFCMLQPKIYKEDEYLNLQGKLQPCYSLTKGLTNRTIKKTAETILQELILPQDYLTAEECTAMGLYQIQEAIRCIHFPKNECDFRNAKKRLAFHEFFSFLFQLRQNKDKNMQLAFESPMIPVADTKRLLEVLPYELTQAQKRVWEEIEQDLSKEFSMNRLIQGDVGSGKTIIAFLALLMTAANGRQGCLMAPTEVLAQQHFESLCELVKKYDLCIRPIMLSGSMSAKAKREVKEGIADGTYNVIIGTHAVIEDTVVYQNLALVITDEQHRFGVKQREKLSKKGKNPHILVMSATPIPRTLAMILYGDLSISVIDELPKGRLPIKNCVVDDSYRSKAYSFMMKEIKVGHQIYVICPMVEVSEATDELENVVDYTRKLKEVFPKEIGISYIHGKMSMSEKSAIMNAFEKHETDILVSTTVIEVGINVPNATVMLVENAQRYGLAQLHQLRGRVGRGDAQSYCIFMSSNSSKQTMERLNILNHSNDGFEIANKDLALRGPGEFSGIRQSGDLGFEIADIYEDSDMLKLADSFCSKILKENNQDEKLRIQNGLKAYKSLNPIDFRTI